MKNLSYLSSILLLMFLLASCGNNGDPTPATATFRVDFAQTGDYERFTKTVAIGGGEFKYRGTNEIMPAALIGEELNISGFSVEASNVRELDITTMTNYFSLDEEGPATMTMTFTIYKNGVKLDEKSYTYTEATKDKSEDLIYKAN